MNDNIGFKCLHYSVVESAGVVEVTVVRKNTDSDIAFGIRTVDNTAKDGAEYERLDKIVSSFGNETEKTF